MGGQRLYPVQIFHPKKCLTLPFAVKVFVMKNTYATLTDWSKWTIEEVVENSQTNIETGLTQKEAARRIKQFGNNTFTTHQTRNIILDFLSHFICPLIIILLVAMGISFSLGEVTDAIFPG